MTRLQAWGACLALGLVLTLGCSDASHGPRASAEWRQKGIVFLGENDGRVKVLGTLGGVHKLAVLHAAERTHVRGLDWDEARQTLRVFGNDAVYEYVAPDFHLLRRVPHQPGLASSRPM